MATELPLLKDLGDIVKHSSQDQRAEMLKRLTVFFADGAPNFTDEHLALFDEIFNRLITEIEIKARLELSARLARIGNAPRQTVRRLAHDDEIAVAAPVLQHSQQLEEPDLLDLAKSKGQQHLLAISGRCRLAEALTDVLVRRGDREVVRRVAGNFGAKLSRSGFLALIRKAEKDGILAEKVGQRSDIPEPMLRELFLQATVVVQRRLYATAPPQVRDKISRVLADISNEFNAANNTMAHPAENATFRKQTQLDGTALGRLASEGRYEEVVAALSVLCKIPTVTMNRVLANKRADPAIVLCKALGFGWVTARAITLLLTEGRGTSAQTLESKYRNFEKLSESGAQDVLRLWFTLHEAK